MSSRTAALLASLLLAAGASAASAQSLDVSKLFQSGKADNLSNGDIVAGLKDALHVGAANTVDVTGKVVAVTTDSDGATNTAIGERMKMLLADAEPTTRPTTQPVTLAAAQGGAAATTQATTKPSKGSTNAMASKTVTKHR